MADQLKFEILKARIEIKHLRRNTDKHSEYRISALKALISTKKTELILS